MKRSIHAQISLLKRRWHRIKAGEAAGPGEDGVGDGRDIEHGHALDLNGLPSLKPGEPPEIPQNPGDQTGTKVGESHRTPRAARGSSGRTTRLHREGRRFEPVTAHQELR